MRHTLGFAIALLVSCAFVSRVSAEDVSLDYLGLQLSANLEIAPNKTLKNDGVALLVHDTLGHDRMEIMAALQDSLREQGVNSLAITLGLGLDKRKGMFDCSIEQDHRHEDAIDEIAAWVQWLKEKGAGAITLMGHGRGANQSALYAINRLDRTVKRVVLASPLMETPQSIEAQYRDQFKRPLRPELAKAEELVANEEDNQLLDAPGFLNCAKAKVTAGAFANYYGANPKFQTTNLLQSIKVPALVVMGGQDPALDEFNAGRGDAGTVKGASFATIAGADRDFRDLGADELAKKIKDFMGTRIQADAGR